MEIFNKECVKRVTVLYLITNSVFPIYPHYHSPLRNTHTHTHTVHISGEKLRLREVKCWLSDTAAHIKSSAS